MKYTLIVRNSERSCYFIPFLPSLSISPPQIKTNLGLLVQSLLIFKSTQFVAKRDNWYHWKLNTSLRIWEEVCKNCRVAGWLDTALCIPRRTLNSPSSQSAKNLPNQLCGPQRQQTGPDSASSNVLEWDVGVPKTQITCLRQYEETPWLETSLFVVS